MLREVASGFDATLLDPEQRAQMQGQLDDPAFPTVQSLVALWRIFKDFAVRWCRAHLPDVDLQTRAFCEELDARAPNGVRKLLGLKGWDDLTVDHVAHLAAVGMFGSSIGHHVVNDLTRDYQMQFHIMPPAMDAEGHPSRGIVYEKRNSVFIAGVKRYMLVDDKVHMPTTLMRQLWARFQDDLKAYEEESSHDPAMHKYHIKPILAGRSIHA